MKHFEGFKVFVSFQEKGLPSRLAKVSFFRRWMDLVNGGNVSPITPSDNLLNEATNRLKIELNEYGRAKMASSAFQEAKKELFLAFSKADLGQWVKKPLEQDEFELEWTKEGIAIKSRSRKYQFWYRWFRIKRNYENLREVLSAFKEIQNNHEFSKDLLLAFFPLVRSRFSCLKVSKSLVGHLKAKLQKRIWFFLTETEQEWTKKSIH